MKVNNTRCMKVNNKYESNRDMKARNMKVNNTREMSK